MSTSEFAPFEYALIINFNKYAGNFERDFCAFVTGMTGECGVGSKEASAFKEWAEARGLDEYAFDGYVTCIQSDDGAHRPTSIWNDKDRLGYEDSIIFLEYPLTPALMEVIRERAQMFEDDQAGGWLHESPEPFKISGIRMIKRTITIVDADQEPLEEADE